MAVRTDVDPCDNFPIAVRTTLFGQRGGVGHGIRPPVRRSLVLEGTRCVGSRQVGNVGQLFAGFVGVVLSQDTHDGILGKLVLRRLRDLHPRFTHRTQARLAGIVVGDLQHVPDRPTHPDRHEESLRRSPANWDCRLQSLVCLLYVPPLPYSCRSDSLGQPVTERSASSAACSPPPSAKPDGRIRRKIPPTTAGAFSLI